MIALFLVFGLLFQTANAPAPLTALQVLEAHQAGVSVQGLLNMIAANPSIAPATDADLLALTQAGVPSAVVDALKARLAPATPAAAGPEDARLNEIVQLVRSGLSEELIARQIRSSGEIYKLSSGDLIFLKHSQVPEAIIAEMISTGSGKGTVQAAKPATFGPLLRMQGFPKRDAAGTLNLKEGRLVWLDEKKVERNFSVELTSIKTAWLICSPRAQGNFCYAIGLSLFNNDKYEFRDASWESGGNTQVLALFDTLKQGYPQIIFHEQVK